MNKLQSQVKEFMLKAGQSCPEKPAEPSEDVRILRVRLLLEEVLEFAEASGVEIRDRCSDADGIYMDNLIFNINRFQNTDIVGVADALADINYVSYGAAIAYGLDMEPLEDSVHENNMTKFSDGYIDENGKLRKGPSYKPVDLTELVNKQIKSND